MSQEDFLASMKEAVKSKNYITVKCLHRLNPYTSQFVSGRIEYCLNFIQTSDSYKDEKWVFKQVTWSLILGKSLLRMLFMKQNNSTQGCSKLKVKSRKYRGIFEEHSPEK